MRDIKKYAEAGHKRLEGNDRYDITNNEINNLMVRGLKSPGDMFFVIADAYCMGVEAGARMTEKKYKEGRCKA